MTRRISPITLVAVSLLIAGCGGDERDDVTDSEVPLTWTKSVGGEGFQQANAIVAAPGGGYIIAGFVGLGNSSDAYLVKISTDGDIIWEQTIGGSGFDSVSSIVATSDGGYLLAGSTNSFGYGGLDSYLLKVDASGNKVWEKAYGGSDDDYAVFACPIGDGYLVAGNAVGIEVSSTNVVLVRTDATGALRERNVRGDRSGAEAYAGAATADGGAIIAGIDPSSGHAFADVYLIRLDNTVSIRWENTYGGTSSIRPRSIAPAGEDYIIAGDIRSSAVGESDAYLAKVSGSGTVIWEQTFVSNHDDELHCAVQASDGGFVLAGWTQAVIIRGSDAYLVKASATGVIEWERTFGGESFDEAFGVTTTAEGGYILVGRTASFGTDGGDFYLIKTDAMGEVTPEP